MKPKIVKTKDRNLKLKLVKCTSDYWEFVRELRNDNSVQDGFIEKVTITPEQQNKYMNRYQDNYFICLYDELPIGYVGVIDNDIRICTLPKYQGKGVASFMLSEIIKIFPKAYGKVKIDNVASRGLFKKVGFTEAFVIFTQDPTSEKA
jgi:RimJ/RimL family protein N-acetyltransferase